MKALTGILFIVVFVCAPVMAQNSVIVPNENLIAEGVPAIPASLAETLAVIPNFARHHLQAGTPASARC